MEFLMIAPGGTAVIDSPESGAYVSLGQTGAFVISAISAREFLSARAES